MNNTVYNCIHTHSEKLLPIMAYHHRGANNESDAALIVAARNALPALLDVAEAAKAYADAMDTPMEWSHYKDRKQVFLDALAKLENTK